MLNRRFACAVVNASLACSLFGQPNKTPAPSGPAAEVLAFEKSIEDAVVRGDVAFMDRALAPDFSFVHGDGWTTGGKPLASDDKKAFLKRVAEKEYLVHDLDSVKTEVHGDIVITYGRYVSLFMPKSASDTPGKLNSIWFERVYAQRNGQWQFLSHRTVHGPTVSPAGVDSSTKTPGPVQPSSVRGLAQQPGLPASPSPEAAEVLKFEQSIGSAIARGDAAYFDRVTASDFVMTHSDRWATGEKPLLLDDKKSFMKRVSDHDYLAHDIDSARAEIHGDVAITYGRYIGHMQHVPAGREWFSVWYEKVYAKRNGQWQYLSHRTVHGATYGLDRESLAGK